MNIAIIGYGKMGHEIERLARTKGMNIVAIIDPNESDATHREISESALRNADVCIDFSTADAVVENVRGIAGLNKNIVMGTTGWNSQLGVIREMVEKNNTGFLYASNFSIGVNLFYRIVENAARMMNNLPSYDVFAYELHHNKKQDSPSGTARTLGELLLKNIKRKDKLVFERLAGRIQQNELHITSVRAGEIPGTHVVGFDSEADTIELKHAARNRSGFALGAILAAEWIKGRKGFFTVDEFIRDLIGGKNV